MGRVQQGDDLLRQLVVVVLVPLAGRDVGEIQQTVSVIVKRGRCDEFPHTAIRQQAGLPLKMPEVTAHGQCAGGQDHRLVLQPEGLAELSGQVGGGGAQHGAAPLILCCVEHHLRPPAAEQFRLAGYLLQLFSGAGRQEVAELLGDHQECPVRTCQQASEIREGPFCIPRPGQLLQQRFCR